MWEDGLEVTAAPSHRLPSAGAPPAWWLVLNKHPKTDLIKRKEPTPAGTGGSPARRPGLCGGTSGPSARGRGRGRGGQRRDSPYRRPVAGELGGMGVFRQTINVVLIRRCDKNLILGYHPPLILVIGGTHCKNIKKKKKPRNCRSKHLRNENNIPPLFFGVLETSCQHTIFLSVEPSEIGLTSSIYKCRRQP